MHRPLLLLLMAAAPQASPPQPTPPRRDDAAAEALGWRLGAQAWTFRDRTAFEAIETLQRLGLKYVELYPGQSFSAEEKALVVGPELDRAHVDALKQKLARHGVTAVSYGVVTLKNDEAAARAQFTFAQALGLENVSAEPEPDALDLVAKLAEEFHVRVAIHNHPKPSRYWSPDVVAAALKGRATWIGACADTGHWTRSGLVPVACLKQLEGHVVELHFKDLDTAGNPDAIDLPWGTGRSDARGILLELKRQGFRGLIDVEYEDGSGAKLEADVAKCIAWFDANARELATPAK